MPRKDLEARYAYEKAYRNGVNREKYLLRKRTWQAKNADKLRIYKKNWFAKGGDKAKAYRRRKRTRENLKRNFGLTIIQYQTRLNVQGPLCAICRQDRKLGLDHCHRTGQIRSFLCCRCNTGLGYLEDEAFRTAGMAYLNSFGKP